MSEQQLKEHQRQLELMRQFCEGPATYVNNFFLLPRGEGVRITFIETVHETSPSIPREAVYLEMDQFRKLIELGAGLIRQMDGAKSHVHEGAVNGVVTGPPPDIIN